MLGELGRYPILIPALKHCLKYEYHISRLDSSSLVSAVFREMDTHPQIDCWKSRVEKIKTLLNVKRLFGTSERAGLIVDRLSKSKFDRFYLDEINQIKLGIDGQDHNKLRLYKKLKGSFKVEPYIVKIRNRNQRMWLTRYRTSSHTLRIETGRYTRPVTPILDRKCCYCESGSIDDEKHFVLFCDTFRLKRQCFMSRVRALHPQIDCMTDDEKLQFILCPPTADLVKCVSKYLGIMTNTRKEIDMGLDPRILNLYLKHVAC